MCGAALPLPCRANFSYTRVSAAGFLAAVRPILEALCITETHVIVSCMVQHCPYHAELVLATLMESQYDEQQLEDQQQQQQQEQPRQQPQHQHYKGAAVTMNTATEMPARTNGDVLGDQQHHQQQQQEQHWLPGEGEDHEDDMLQEDGAGGGWQGEGDAEVAGVTPPSGAGGAGAPQPSLTNQGKTLWGRGSGHGKWPGLKL